MALITCKECGDDNVSDRADSCPSCGFPFEKERVADEGDEEDEKGSAALGCGCLLVFVVMLFSFCGSFGCPQCEGTGRYVTEGMIKLAMYSEGVSRATAIQDAIDAGLSHGKCKTCDGEG